MAAQAQLIPTPLPPPPTYSPPPHSPTQDQWSSQPVDPSDKAEGRWEKGSDRQPGEGGRRGSSTRAEEEAVQRKIS